MVKNILTILLTLSILIGFIATEQIDSEKGCFCFTWNQSNCRNGLQLIESALRGCFCLTWDQSSCGK
jgi:hypothetical protein